MTHNDVTHNDKCLCPICDAYRRGYLAGYKDKEQEERLRK